MKLDTETRRLLAWWLFYHIDGIGNIGAVSKEEFSPQILAAWIQDLEVLGVEAIRNQLLDEMGEFALEADRLALKGEKL